MRQIKISNFTLNILDEKEWDESLVEEWEDLSEEEWDELLNKDLDKLFGKEWNERSKKDLDKFPEEEWDEFPEDYIDNIAYRHEENSRKELKKLICEYVDNLREISRQEIIDKHCFPAKIGNNELKSILSYFVDNHLILPQLQSWDYLRFIGIFKYRNAILRSEVQNDMLSWVWKVYQTLQIPNIDHGSSRRNEKYGGTYVNVKTKRTYKDSPFGRHNNSQILSFPIRQAYTRHDLKAS